MKSHLAGLLLIAALSLAFAPGASAQGCPMCYNAAAAQDAKAKKALDAGIFLLVSPVLLLAGGVVFLAYKRREAPGGACHEVFDLQAPEADTPSLLELPLDDTPPPRAHLSHASR